MTYLLKSFFTLVSSLDDYSDARTNDIFLMRKPFFGIIPLILFYNYFVNKWGPRLMQKYQPFNLDKFVILYNVLQIFVCLYIVLKLIIVLPHFMKCGDIDYSNSHSAITLLNVWTIYFYVKISDLLDTVIFVFRKKFNQVSFLHVYHHSGMIILGWIGTKFYAGGRTAFIPLINSIVHAIMYSYYLATILDKNRSRYDWIKKYITLLQMIQFLIFIMLSGSVLTYGCGLPAYLAAVFLIQNIFMLFLFGDFFVKSYIRKSNLKKKDSTVRNGTNLRYNQISSN